MKRKAIMTMALAMAITAGSLSGLNVPMTVHAAEAADEGIDIHDENNDVGDILDDIFGGNKPEYNPDAPDSGYDNGGWLGGGSGWQDPILPSEPSGGGNSGGSSDSGSSKPAEPSTPPSNPSGGNSENNDVGDILDDIFGGNKPEYNPDAPDSGYDNGGWLGGGSGWQDPILPSEPSGGGNSDSGSSKPAEPFNPGTGSGTANQPAVPGVQLPVVPGAPVAVQPGAGNGLTVTNPIAVAPTAVATPIADPEIQALFPDAAFVQTAVNVTLHAFDATKQTYQVWEAGNVVTELSIVDSKNRVLLMDTPQLVPGADGRVFLNVAVNTTKTVKVNATDDQKAAFAGTYGIHGVMVNGVLVEEFVAPSTVKAAK